MKSLLLTLICISTLLASQSATSENASVEGFVGRASTGEPLSDVQVQLNRDYGATTDRNGHFAIGNLPPAAYSVTVQRAGFVAVGQGPSIGSNSAAIGRIIVSAKERIDDFQIEMAATGIISGRVAGANGQPLANFLIQGLRRSYQDGRMRIGPFNLPSPARTDDRGEYRVIGLPPGEYFILTNPPPAQQTQSGPLAAYFPGTRDLDRALPILVKEGEETPHIDFTLQNGTPVTITGYVVPDAPDAPLTQLSIGPVPRTPDVSMITMYGFSFSPTTIPPGQFTIRSFPIAPGPYDLFVAATGRTMDYFGSTSINVVDQPLSDIAVAVHPGMEVTGHVTIQGKADGIKFTGLPMALRSVPYTSSNRTYNLQMTALTSTLRTGAAAAAPGAATAAVAEPEVTSDGSFIIRSMPPGRYTVVPSLPSETCLIDATQEGKSILESGMTIGAKKPAPIEVVISTNCSKVEGLLQEGDKPRSFVRVILIPDSSRRQSYGLYRMVTSDQRGRFSFDSVTPGAYKVFAWKSIPEGAWTNEMVLAKYENQGASVNATAVSPVTNLKVELISN